MCSAVSTNDYRTQKLERWKLAHSLGTEIEVEKSQRRLGGRRNWLLALHQDTTGPNGNTGVCQFHQHKISSYVDGMTSPLISRAKCFRLSFNCFLTSTGQLNLIVLFQSSSKFLSLIHGLFLQESFSSINITTCSIKILGASGILFHKILTVANIVSPLHVRCRSTSALFSRSFTKIHPFLQQSSYLSCDP